MKKHFVVLLALTFGCAAAAHADPISGFFSAHGTDTFTSNSITFTPNDTANPSDPNNSVVSGALGGTFANYLTDGNLITFALGTLPYSVGTNTPPASSFPLGYVPDFFSTTEAGETFAFNLTDYTAGYITNGTDGCAVGGTCLEVTGDGFFTGTGPVDGTSGNATFTFTSQYVPGQPLADTTTFSASTSALAPTPEPTPLALMGTGLLGLAALVKRARIV